MRNKSKYILKIYFYNKNHSREKKPAYTISCDNSKIIDELYNEVCKPGLVKFYYIIFDSEKFCCAELQEN